MKTLLIKVLSLMILSAPAQAHASSPTDELELVLVGNVESKSYSTGYFGDARPTTISVGFDGARIRVRIHIRVAYLVQASKIHIKDFYSRKCSQRDINENKCDDKGLLIMEDYEALKKILKKSIEWSRIAIKNRVERISKKITIGRNSSIQSPFGTGDAMFFATLNHQRLVLPVHLKDPLGPGEDRLVSYDLDSQIKLLDLLENEVPAILDRLMRDQAHFN